MCLTGGWAYPSRGDYTVFNIFIHIIKSWPDIFTIFTVFTQSRFESLRDSNSFVTIRDSLWFFCPKLYTVFKGFLCGLEIPTKKAILRPRALGPLGSQISQKRSSSFFEKICRANASKRIIANQLEHKVDWTLKFHFLYCRRAMLKTGSFVRHVTWHPIYLSTRIIGPPVVLRTIMGELIWVHE